MTDPFSVLGLGPDATSDDVRARRGVNSPSAIIPTAVVTRRRCRPSTKPPTTCSSASVPPPPAAGTPAGTPAGDESQRDPSAPGLIADEPGGGVSRDVPSFTVEALPVETFEGLLIVASWIGDVLDDDPPYRLDTHLHEPVECWCRLDVVPDAGASTVSLTIAGVDGAPTPDIIAVRDLWIANLNAVDWS